MDRLNRLRSSGWYAEADEIEELRAEVERLRELIPEAWKEGYRAGSSAGINFGMDIGISPNAERDWIVSHSKKALGGE